MTPRRLVLLGVLLAVALLAVVLSVAGHAR